MKNKNIKASKLDGKEMRKEYAKLISGGDVLADEDVEPEPPQIVAFSTGGGHPTRPPNVT